MLIEWLVAIDMIEAFGVLGLNGDWNDLCIGNFKNIESY